MKVIAVGDFILRMGSHRYRMRCRLAVLVTPTLAAELRLGTGAVRDHTARRHADRRPRRGTKLGKGAR